MKKLMIGSLTTLLIISAVIMAGCSSQAETKPISAPIPAPQPERTEAPLIEPDGEEKPIEFVVFTLNNSDDVDFITRTNFIRYESNHSMSIEMEVAEFWKEPRINGIEPRDVMIYVMSDAFDPGWLDKLKKDSDDDEFQAFVEDCTVKKVVLHFIEKPNRKLLGTATMTGSDPWSEADVHTTWKRRSYHKIPEWMV